MVPVNYLAILVAAIGAMAVGFVWYGLIFRKKWMDLMGYSTDSMRDMKMTANKAYAIQFVASLLMAYLLSHVIIFVSAYMERGGVSVGLSTGFYSWLGFVVPVTLGSVLWENRPWKLWFINASSYLLTLLVMGAIIGLWN